MTSFALPSDAGTDTLAANMDEFNGKPVAIQAITTKTVPVNTSFGTSNALRVRIVDLATGVLTSPHLLFWSKVQEQVLGTHAKGIDWAIGRLTQQPQKADPTRSVWLLSSEGMESVDYEQVGRFLEAAENADVHFAGGMPITSDAPFA